MSVLLPVQVYITAGRSYELESKLRRLEQSAKNRFGGTTDSELSELEDVVALTAARVQSAESEVRWGLPSLFIQNISALTCGHWVVGFWSFTACLFALQVSDIESKIAALSAKKKVSLKSEVVLLHLTFRCVLVQV